MTYLSGRQQRRKKLRLYFLYISIFFLVFFFWASVKGVLYPVLEPVVFKYGGTKKTLIGIPEFFSTYVISRKTIIEKDKALEINIENLENVLAEKDAKLKELGVVVEDFGDGSISSTLVMYPLMNDATKIYSTILLSKGFKDGVEKDEYVYVRGLQPVCIIKEVYTSSSLCELITSSNVVTEAVIQTSTTTIAINLLGRGGGTFLGDVARDTPVAIGDKVYLKSDPSMTLGVVSDVLHNNQDTSWHVFVRGTYNPIKSSIFYIRKK